MLTGSRHPGRLLREGLHAVDQALDAVGLVDDQLGQRRVLRLGRAAQQLRRAADAGERVLDLVRQHAAEADHRLQRPGQPVPLGRTALPRSARAG